MRPLTGDMPTVAVKMPTWSSTEGWRSKKASPMVSEKVEYGSSDDGLVTPRKDRATGSRNSKRASIRPGTTNSEGLGSKNKSAPGVLETSTPLGLKQRVDVVSNVSTYLEESRRDQRLLKDFLKTRSFYDTIGEEDSGLGNLMLFHSPSQRAKAKKRKRPPIAVMESQEPRRRSSQIASTPADANAAPSRRASASNMSMAEACAAAAAAHAAAAGGRRGSKDRPGGTPDMSGAGRRGSISSVAVPTAGIPSGPAGHHLVPSATAELHKLCTLLGSSAPRSRSEMKVKVERPVPAAPGVTKASLNEPQRKRAEDKFMNAMKTAGPSTASEETTESFGRLLALLLQKFGTLELAFKYLDYKVRGRLKKDEWEAGVAALGFKELPGKPKSLPKIFSVLDQDHDNWISPGDLTCYEPYDDPKDHISDGVKEGLMGLMLGSLTGKLF